MVSEICLFAFKLRKNSLFLRSVKNGEELERLYTIQFLIVWHIELFRTCEHLSG